MNPRRLLEGFGWSEFQWRRGELRNELAGRSVMVGVDDMDVFKGIELKLQAFEKLLAEHEEFRGQVVLVQVGQTAGGGWGDVGMQGRMWLEVGSSCC